MKIIYNINMKQRLDKIVSIKNKDISRTKAQSLIEGGFVLVDGKVTTNVSYLVDEKNNIELLRKNQYVSRGAYKLLGAIENFGIDFSNRIVLDIGASTGGFSEVALEMGAKKVYAVDVGKGQLHEKLARNDKVINLQERDFRSLDISEVSDVDIIIGDVSFISLTKIFTHIKELFGSQTEMMFLFKPQFECGPVVAKKYKGLIKNKDIHKNLLTNFEKFANLLGFSFSGLAPSPIKGGDGNIEYLIYFSKDKHYKFNIDSVVDGAFSDKKEEL